MKNVIAKLKLILTNNIGIKIIAVIIAAIIWLAVVNINDPKKTVVIYNVPVTITDEEVLIEEGMVYDSSQKYTVNVTVNGNRSVVSKLTANDFYAQASLKELSKVNAVPVTVMVKDGAVSRGITIIKQSAQTISLEIEQITRREFGIDAEFRGSLGKGYVQGDYTLYQDKVTIDAPSSVFDKIDKVVAVCNFDNDKSDVKGQECKIVLYDRNGKKINLKKNKITLSTKKVTIDVDILKEVEVSIAPLTPESIGKPADDCVVTDIILKEDTITVVGEENVIDSIKTIDISSKIDISNDDKSVTKKIDITEFLPEGATSANGNIVTVEILIDKYITKSFTLLPEDIVLKNVGEAFSAKIASKKISISLYGIESVLTEMSLDDITVTVDMSGLNTSGMHVMKADIQTSEDVSTVNEVTVKVNLINK